MQPPRKTILAQILGIENMTEYTIMAKMTSNINTRAISELENQWEVSLLQIIQ